MNTLQIEDITTGAQRTRLWRAVDAAAALAACGHTIRYKKQEIPSASRIEHTWFVDTGVHDAHQLLLRAAIASGPESLLHRSPEHPFLAGLFGIRALRALISWFAAPALPPVAVKPAAAGRLLCLSSIGDRLSDLMPILWATEKPVDDVAIKEPQSAAFCAAAAVCGFLPHPRLTGPDVPHVHFAATSLTFPGLTMAHFQQPQIPGTADGSRHPFSYALTAALNWQAFTAREERERRKTFLLKSRYSQRTAIISGAILDEANGEAAKAREEIEEHLAAA